MFLSFAMAVRNGILESSFYELCLHPWNGWVSTACDVWLSPCAAHSIDVLYGLSSVACPISVVRNRVRAAYIHIVRS